MLRIYVHRRPIQARWSPPGLRAVEFIKANIKLEGVTSAGTDSKKVVEICTKYAQAGMINIFW